MDAKAAQKRFEMENNFTIANDDIYKYNEKEQNDIRGVRPWKKDPHYFKNVKISGIALVKMLIHAKDGLSKTPGKGEDLEVMGLLQGKVEGDTIIVMDVFGVLKGSEVRVIAGTGDIEYMVNYTETSEKVGKNEPVVGWYHSHPGFGCWFSGVDVTTQFNNQNFQDPYLGIVIDPKRTLSSGRVDIKAFRTWPEGYQVPEQYKLKAPKGKGEFEFGVHAHRYYELKVSFFKSQLDSVMLKMLWLQYWAKTISVSRNLLNRDFDASQLSELEEHLREAEADLEKGKGIGAKKKDEPDIAVVAKECSKIAGEQLNGVLDQLVKHQLFNIQMK